MIKSFKAKDKYNKAQVSSMTFFNFFIPFSIFNKSHKESLSDIKINNRIITKYSINKIQRLLNAKNINEINFQKKGETPKNFKFINPNNLRKESIVHRKMSKRNLYIIKKRNNSDIFNTFYYALLNYLIYYSNLITIFLQLLKLF